MLAFDANVETAKKNLVKRDYYGITKSQLTIDPIYNTDQQKDNKRSFREELILK